ncbi:hypothetical protein KA050_04250 [Candidatus Gracilibacteria bacterium]|nr:hypothetical protein [Candidatus Gracilibacteria bacterium]
MNIKAVSVMTILGAFALGGGMYFSRIDEKFLGSTFTNSVQSQTIKITPKATTPEEKEKILKRIEAIKKEILSEINDPDRAIQLRSELYDLEKQIEEPKE